MHRLALVGENVPLLVGLGQPAGHLLDNRQ
jgi:hypothetical protein